MHTGANQIYFIQLFFLRCCRFYDSAAN